MSSKFKIVRPFPVSDVSLVSSTVSATDALASSGAYSAATTYPLGAVVQVDSPSGTVTYIASTDTLQWAGGHPLVVGDMVSFTTTGALPPGLSVGVAYYVVRITSITGFKVSLTKGGAPVDIGVSSSGAHTCLLSSHRLYESLVAGNLGNTPRLSPSQWLDLGMTNRWKPFDQSVTSQVEQVDSLSYVIQVKGRADSIALMNVSAAEVVITARESGGGAIVYGPTTYSLLSSTPATSFWSWFFDPIERKTDFVDMDFPPYNNLEVTITLNDTGNTVRCGALIVGLSKTFGDTLVGTSTGITDYSYKSQDDFGNYTVTERTFRKNGSFSIMADRVVSDGIQATLAQYRAIPIVYVGSSAYTSTIIYGFYRDFSVTIEAATYSICTIDIEGLT